MHHTEWHYSENRRERSRLIYGAQRIGEQAPYFSLTSETEAPRRGGKWEIVSCGAGLPEHGAPEWAPIIACKRWHLCSPDGPMHYVSGAIYWAEQIAISKRKPHDADPVACFASTVVLGAIPGETIPPLHIPEATMIPRDHIGIVVREWCAARLPALLEAMRADLKGIGVEL